MKNYLIVSIVFLGISAAGAQTSAGPARAQLNGAAEVDGAVWADNGMAVSPEAPTAGKSAKALPLAPAGPGRALDEAGPSAGTPGLKKLSVPFERDFRLFAGVMGGMGLAVAAIVVGVVVAPPAGLIIAGALAGAALLFILYGITA